MFPVGHVYENEERARTHCMRRRYRYCTARMEQGVVGQRVVGPEPQGTQCNELSMYFTGIFYA